MEQAGGVSANGSGRPLISRQQIGSCKSSYAHSEYRPEPHTRRVGLLQGEALATVIRVRFQQPIHRLFHTVTHPFYPASSSGVPSVIRPSVRVEVFRVSISTGPRAAGRLVFSRAKPSPVMPVEERPGPARIDPHVPRLSRGADGLRLRLDSTFQRASLGCTGLNLPNEGVFSEGRGGLGGLPDLHECAQALEPPGKAQERPARSGLQSARRGPPAHPCPRLMIHASIRADASEPQGVNGLLGENSFGVTPDRGAMSNKKFSSFSYQVWKEILFLD